MSVHDVKIEIGTETFTPDELVEDIVFSLKFYTKIEGRAPYAHEVTEVLRQLMTLLQEAHDALD